MIGTRFCTSQFERYLAIINALLVHGLST